MNCDDFDVGHVSYLFSLSSNLNSILDGGFEDECLAYYTTSGGIAEMIDDAFSHYEHIQFCGECSRLFSKYLDRETESQPSPRGVESDIETTLRGFVTLSAQYCDRESIIDGLRGLNSSSNRVILL